MKTFATLPRALQSLALTLVLTLVGGNVSGRPADRHPFGLDDASALRFARAVSVSPDGKTILFAV